MMSQALECRTFRAHDWMHQLMRGLYHWGYPRNSSADLLERMQQCINSSTVELARYESLQRLDENMVLISRFVPGYFPVRTKISRLHITKMVRNCFKKRKTYQQYVTFDSICKTFRTIVSGSPKRYYQKRWMRIRNVTALLPGVLREWIFHKVTILNHKMSGNDTKKKQNNRFFGRFGWNRAAFLHKNRPVLSGFAHLYINFHYLNTPDSTVPKATRPKVIFKKLIEPIKNQRLIYQNQWYLKPVGSSRGRKKHDFHIKRTPGTRKTPFKLSKSMVLSLEPIWHQYRRKTIENML